MDDRSSRRSASPAILLLIRLGLSAIFAQHGAQKIFGVLGATPVDSYFSQFGIAGLLETIGPALVALGLWTRPTAFVLSGEMAVAYFITWAPRGFWPIANGGEESALFSFAFLWLAAAGAGDWSLDAWIRARRTRAGWFSDLSHRAAALEPAARAALRMFVALVVVLHGARKAFGLLPVIAGRLAAPPFALDGLPSATGFVDIACGLLVGAGLLARPAAALLVVELVAAYVIVASPRTPWPRTNGGGEALIAALCLLAVVAAGAGAWGLDAVRRRSSAGS